MLPLVCLCVCVCSYLWGGARSLCERPQGPEQGGGFDEAAGQPSLQRMQWRRHVLILKHGGEELAKDLWLEIDEDIGLMPQILPEIIDYCPKNEYLCVSIR